ncbi:MAG: hypothetical protein SFZ23_08605 [Planctomycetota bacterium]|nr:hypothetical protein [Planctomycetota bacterium]
MDPTIGATAFARAMPFGASLRDRAADELWRMLAYADAQEQQSQAREQQAQARREQDATREVLLRELEQARGLTGGQLSAGAGPDIPDFTAMPPFFGRGGPRELSPYASADVGLLASELSHARRRQQEQQERDNVELDVQRARREGIIKQLPTLRRRAEEMGIALTMEDLPKTEREMRRAELVDFARAQGVANADTLPEDVLRQYAASAASTIKGDSYAASPTFEQDLDDFMRLNPRATRETAAAYLRQRSRGFATMEDANISGRETARVDPVQKIQGEILADNLKQAHEALRSELAEPLPEPTPDNAEVVQAIMARRNRLRTQVLLAERQLQDLYGPSSNVVNQPPSAVGAQPSTPGAPGSARAQLIGRTARAVFEQQAGRPPRPDPANPGRFHPEDRAMLDQIRRGLEAGR